MIPLLQSAVDRAIGCLFEPDVLKACFADPFTQGTGYNLPMTLAYGAILILLSFFVLFPILDRAKIKFDYAFLRALLPYILLGAGFRLIEVTGIVQREFNPLSPGFYFQTPGIWFLTAAITLLALAITRHAWKEKFADYFGGFGALLLLGLLAFLSPHFMHWDRLYLTVLILGIVSAVAYFGYNALLRQPFTKFAHAYLAPNLFKNKANVLAMIGQAMDGFATVVAVVFYGFSEQHVISDVLLTTNPLLFPIVKIVLVLVILTYIDTEIKNENLRGFARLFLIVLGWATGGASLWKLGL